VVSVSLFAIACDYKGGWSVNCSDEVIPLIHRLFILSYFIQIQQKTRFKLAIVDCLPGPVQAAAGVWCTGAYHAACGPWPGFFL
jgi:hypothetical protein